ncbi:MAG: thrombospondin type 3 repeat-containing protein [Planctomycetota bacterium]
MTRTWQLGCMALVGSMLCSASYARDTGTGETAQLMIPAGTTVDVTVTATAFFLGGIQATAVDGDTTGLSGSVTLSTIPGATDGAGIVIEDLVLDFEPVDLSFVFCSSFECMFGLCPIAAACDGLPFTVQDFTVTQSAPLCATIGSSGSVDFNALPVTVEAEISSPPDFQLDSGFTSEELADFDGVLGGAGRTYVWSGLSDQSYVVITLGVDSFPLVSMVQWILALDMSNVQFVGTAQSAPVDTDRDGVLDACDNCPAVANAGQEDADMNGVGDACEAQPCPEDCAPDNGDGTFGNGVINIDDLLAVINAFGSAGGPCDAAPDNGDGTFGNGIINIDDLLAVINAFGDCP